MVKKSSKIARRAPDIQSLPLFRERLGVLLSYAGTSYYELYRDKIAPLGLRPSWVTALAVIEQEPGITQSSLGRWMAINRASAMAIASGMEDAGLITRSPLPGRNQTALHLTTEGTCKLHDACSVETDLTHHILAGISDTESQILRHALLKVLNASAVE